MADERPPEQSEDQPKQLVDKLGDPAHDKLSLRLSGRPALIMALLMATSASFVLCGYELLRTTATTLFTSVYGQEWLPLAMGMVPVGVTLVLYFYGRLLSWLGPRRTLLVTTLLSMATMVACYAGIRLGIRATRGVLYVFKESYVVLLIEQHWSYINSMLSKDSARRLNGPITGVASVGASTGGWLLGQFSVPWGTLSMVLVAAVLTLPALLFTNWAYRRFGEPVDKPPPQAPGQAGAHQSHLRLDLFRKQPLLLLIIGLVVSAQLVAAVQELLLQNLFQQHFPSPDVRNAVSGRFYFWLNLGAMFFQFALTPLLLSVLPYSLVHLIIPCVHLTTLAYSLMMPTSLIRAEASYFLFKALDYSLFRSAKELLYVPLSFDVRYRAKEIIDVFGYRLSKGAASLSIHFLHHGGVVFTNPTYAMVGMGAALVWLMLVAPIARYGHGK